MVLFYLDGQASQKQFRQEHSLFQQAFLNVLGYQCHKNYYSLKEHIFKGFFFGFNS